MSLHLSAEQIEALPLWEDTPHGRAEAAAVQLADEFAPFVMERVLTIVHQAAVSAMAWTVIRDMRRDPVFTALAPALDPLLACAVSASEESADMPDGTVGLDGTAVIHTLLSAIVDDLGLPAAHPALIIEDDGLETTRISTFLNCLSDSDHHYEPPWNGPHPLTDRVLNEDARIDPDHAVDLTRRAIAILKETLP